MPTCSPCSRKIGNILDLAGVSAGTRVLEITTQQNFGPDYARTLRLWRERFSRNAEIVADLGFDAVFRRMWEFYLAYSEAGFRSGYLNVAQFALTRR